MPEAPATETVIGPDLPTLRIGDGPRTLLYLPGLSLHPRAPTGQERSMALSGWEPLLDRYTVYRAGRRVRPVGTTFAEMADDAAAAIEQLGGPVDVMGASTGGIIAMHLAASRPDLVRRLVLVTTGVEFSPAARRMATRVSAAATAGRWRRVFASIVPIAATSRKGRAGWTAFGWLLGPRLIGVPTDPTLLLAELAAWQSTDAMPPVERITCPTLLIGTDLDPVFPPASTRALAERLPDARLVIVPKVAHDFPAGALRDNIGPFLG